MKTSLPNLIIAGINKSGTTSLFSWLSAHPDVCASRIKETCHFLPVRYGKTIEPLEVYRSYFRHHAEEKIILESTPGYFYGGLKVAACIREQLGNVKIVIALRNPVERLLSFYKFKKAELEISAEMTLSGYIRKCRSMSQAELGLQENNTWYGIEGGYYSVRLREWLSVFGTDLKVIFFEDIRTRELQALTGLCKWLGIDPAFYHSASLRVENKTVHFRNRPLQKAALGINKLGERFWRSNPGLKNALRSAYYAVNGRPYGEKFSPETIRELNALYEDDMASLGKVLQEAGYPLPSWLAGAGEGVR